MRRLPLAHGLRLPEKEGDAATLALRDGDGDLLALAVAVAVGDCDTVARTLALCVGLAVGDGVAQREGEGDGVLEPDSVGDFVIDAVSEGEAIDEGDGEREPDVDFDGVGDDEGQMRDGSGTVVATVLPLVMTVPTVLPSLHTHGPIDDRPEKPGYCQLELDSVWYA